MDITATDRSLLLKLCEHAARGDAGATSDCDAILASPGILEIVRAGVLDVGTRAARVTAHDTDANKTPLASGSNTYRYEEDVRAMLEKMTHARAGREAKEKADADSKPKPLKPLQPHDVYPKLPCGCHRGLPKLAGCEQHKDQP